ncbi:hypothetical protein MKX03_024593 [Papaver bracteatum]|nr:hypothetical protein MKX03_024593 [Papaver bracteatum]
MLSPNPAKRLKTNNRDNEDSSSSSSNYVRLWKDLNPEMLSLIFARIQTEELVRTAPFVCQPWREAVTIPCCWSDIDIQQWCRRSTNILKIDSVVLELVCRSQGKCHRLSVHNLSDIGFDFVASYCAKHLKVLQIPLSGVTDKMLEKHATSFGKLTFLDISNCLHITCRGLEILGNNCKSLTSLKRNMPPLDWEEAEKPLPARVNDGEAMVIADTMAALCHLELCYGRFGDLGLDALVTKCENLIHLDILGAVCVQLDGDLLDKCERLVEFRGPWDDSYSEDDGDDNEAAVLSSDSDSDQ